MKRVLAYPFVQDYQMNLHSVNLSSYESWNGFQTPPQEVGIVGNVLKFSRNMRDSLSVQIIMTSDLVTS